MTCKQVLVFAKLPATCINPVCAAKQLQEYAGSQTSMLVIAPELKPEVPQRRIQFSHMRCRSMRLVVSSWLKELELCSCRGGAASPIRCLLLCQLSFSGHTQAMLSPLSRDGGLHRFLSCQAGSFDGQCHPLAVQQAEAGQICFSANHPAPTQLVVAPSSCK